MNRKKIVKIIVVILVFLLINPVSIATLIWLVGGGNYNANPIDEYPISYGEGVTWSCIDERLSLSAYFVTEHINYCHYGKGKLNYGEYQEISFQLMFEMYEVTFLNPQKYSNEYFKGTCDFSKDYMKVTVTEVFDERFSALKNTELVFYPTSEN